MFDIGFLELVVILVLALLVLGPERLPKAARSVGYWFGKARRYVEGMKAQVESEFDTTEVKRLLHNQEVQIRELQGKLQDTVKDTSDAYINPLDDDDDPGNGHRPIAGQDDEDKPSAPQYEMIEEDDGSWGELQESNPSKEELQRSSEVELEQSVEEESMPDENRAEQLSKARNE